MSEPVKRYDMYTDRYFQVAPEECPKGPWVTYDDYAALRAQLAAAERERDSLREALEGLHDEQNGPPLERRAARWQAAMDAAELLLGINQGTNP